MLVLGRKENQTIDITVPPSTEPKDITLKVVLIKGNIVRIGLDAPQDVEIKRGELEKQPRRAANPKEANDTDA